MIVSRGGHDGAGNSRYAVVGHVHHPDGAVLRSAAADGPEGQVQGVQQGVIPVKDRQSLRLQVLKNLALGLEDPLPAAQMLDVASPMLEMTAMSGRTISQIADLPKWFMPVSITAA